ncbi:hypothetical protein RB653_008171 [Dictyostelium firmibasis]|uniref:Response regulatory domain-containing protein n=1 Tax=Dictyostelium firmibasis TaxID=79012 RepID=A0AAN7TS63_9MYCE
MESLREICISKTISIIKRETIIPTTNDNKFFLKGYGIQYLTSDILEDILNRLKDIDHWKFNNQMFDIILNSNINYLNLRNEDEIDFNLSIIGNNNDNSNNNSNNNKTNNNKSLYFSLIKFDISFQPKIKESILFKFLNNFKILKILNLSYCSLIDCTTITNTTNLSKSLVSLNLRGCSNITSIGFKNIGKELINLKELILSKTNITNKDCKYFKHLKNLAILKLNHCHEVSKDGLEYISKLSHLQSLYLSYCTLLQAPNSFKSLLENKSNISTLNISYCLIDDNSIGTIVIINNKENSKEREVEFEEEEETVESTNDLVKIKSLTSLSIRHNRITTKFLKSLSREKELLEKLKRLDLRQSNFIDVESALCLYPYMCDEQCELYISNNNHSINRRSSRFVDNNHGRINLQQLYDSYNHNTIKSKGQIQLNRSSLRLSILERQKHSPLILLGEDEKFQATIVKNVLERKNFDVRIAPNGKVAYEMFCEIKLFQLVIVDVFMPVIDGLRSVKLIRQYESNHQIKRCPIIICSGNESVIRSGNTSKDTGGDAFISKPFRPNLIDLVYKMIGTNENK